MKLNKIKKMISDPSMKFFSAPGKLKLKPILKKVKTNITIKSILVNNYIIKCFIFKA